MRQTKLEMIKQDVDNEEWAAGYRRNEALIDLSFTPSEIKEQVLEQFNRDPGDRSNLFNYFVKRRLNNLVENISEF